MSAVGRSLERERKVNANCCVCEQVEGKVFSGGQNPAAADVLSRIRQTCKFSGASSARTYMPIGPFFFFFLVSLLFADDH